VPRFSPAAWPVLGYRRWNWLAQLLARCQGSHVAVIKHRSPINGMSALPRERHYLVDTDCREHEITFNVPTRPTLDRVYDNTLIICVTWWLAEPHLLLSTAPAHAPQLLAQHVTRTVHAMLEPQQELDAQPNDELLALRRHVDRHLAERTVTTATGIMWILHATRARTTSARRAWRKDLDNWLHTYLEH
jgi:hypothetical protein